MPCDGERIVKRVSGQRTTDIDAERTVVPVPSQAPAPPRHTASVIPIIPETAIRAAVCAAARFGITSTEPVVLADGANIVVHLRPAPVVAKVAASTPEVRLRVQDWLQRELDVSAFLAAAGAPVVPPSPDLPATTHHGDGHVMSFWHYLPPADPSCPLRADEETIGGRPSPEPVELNVN
jgi:hypothetical protein